MNAKPTLTDQQQQALTAGNGFVEGEGFVLMSEQVYRDTMGVGADEELAATLAAIKEGMADVAAGRTIPMEQLRRELDEKYGVHR